MGIWFSAFSSENNTVQKSLVSVLSFPTNPHSFPDSKSHPQNSPGNWKIWPSGTTHLTLLSTLFYSALFSPGLLLDFCSLFLLFLFLRWIFPFQICSLLHFCPGTFGVWQHFSPASSRYRHGLDTLLTQFQPLLSQTLALTCWTSALAGCIQNSQMRNGHSHPVSLPSLPNFSGNRFEGRYFFEFILFAPSLSPLSRLLDAVVHL